jgi:glycosyltransferase involved in cell wall biosynthesis
MRIAEIINTLEIGGLERLVVDLALNLHTRGHEPVVICLRGAGPLAEPLEAAGVRVIALGKSEGFSLRTVSKLAGHLREERIDVVHTHNPLVHHYGVLGARLAGVSAVVNTRHGLGNFPRSAKTEWIFGLACWQTDRVVAVCQAAREYFRNSTAIPARKLACIPNGIPAEKYLAIRPKTPDSTFVFGSVGRLVAVKNHRCLLTAFSLLLRRKPNCRLELLGDGPMRLELEELSRSLGIQHAVDFRGSDLDVPSFLSRLDAFVLCSESEGLPLTVLEAMAAGLAVIGTAVGGIPELLADGPCGWLCPPSQPERLVEMMVNAAEAADRMEIGARGRERVRDHYTLARMTEEYELLFRGILNGREKRL